MIKTLPLFVRKSKVFNEIFNSEDKQIANLELSNEDVEQQMSVDTATWGLKIFEKELDIKTDTTKSYRERRDKIKSKMRSMVGKVDAELIKTIAETYIDGQVGVLFEGGRIKLKFNINNIDSREYHKVFEFNVGMTPAYPESKNGFENVSLAIDEVKPAHLRLVFSSTIKDVMVFREQLKIKKRTYHIVNEFRVGMTLLKEQSEMIV